METETTEELIERLSLTDFFLDEQPYATLFSIFQTCFLNQSVLRGVIEPENATLSGDGTPVVTAARERSHKICDCISKDVFRCSCPRFFSQPDCDIGWDSSRNLYYSGYDLYLMTDTNSGLPLFPLFHPASKHDSHGFCEAFLRFLAFLPAFKPSRLTLDSAHDVMAIYALCQSLSILPFIDVVVRVHPRFGASRRDLFVERNRDVSAEIFSSRHFPASFAVLMPRRGVPRRQCKGYQQGSAKAIHEKRQRTRRKSSESNENRIPCGNPVFGG